MRDQRARTTLVCFFVLIIGVNAVIEKTREDAERRRRPVFEKHKTNKTLETWPEEGHRLPDRLHGRHRVRPGAGESSSSHHQSSSSATSQLEQRPGGSRNIGLLHRLEKLRPPRLHGSIQLGPGLKFDVMTDFGWEFGKDDRWWKGPNVCFRNETHEEVEKEDKDSEPGWVIFPHRMMASYTCDDTGTSYKCTTVRTAYGKTTRSVEVYECCAGHERNEDDDEPGCTEEVIMTDLLSTLERLNLTDMLEALRMSGLTRLLKNHNFTIFAPINDAFQKYRVEETNSNVVKITPDMMDMAKDMDDTVISHIVRGSVKTTDVEDEQLLKTELDSVDIRINKYNTRTNRLMTANCVPMVRKDVPATDGMVHIVGDLLQPVTMAMDRLILGNPQLTQFSKVLKSLELKSHGQYTLFAPTDAAFQKLKPSMLEKIHKGHRCGIDILRQHLLPNVICSAVLQNHAKSKNVLDHYVTFAENLGQLSVDGAQIIQKDIMATNGVIHVIDEVLIPDNAGDILEAAEHSGTSHFLELIKASGLAKKLSDMTNFTMFLPTNEAVKALPADVLESLNKSVDYLERLVSYHVVPRRIKYRSFTDDLELPTLDGENKLLVKDYHSFPFSRHSLKTVQCATVVKADMNSCGDMVHIINKVLLLPSGDVLHVLEKNPVYSRLVAIVKKHKLESLFQTEKAFTFFAPTNKAFELLSSEEQNKFQNDTEKLTKILKSHMIEDVLCCDGVFGNAFSILSRQVNMDGWVVSLSNFDSVRFGNVPVASCDNTATNGVVHGIDRFLPSVLTRYRVSNPRRLFFHLPWDWISHD